MDLSTWIEFVEETSRALDIPLINVVDELRSLPPEEVKALFISKAQVRYASVVGHYSENGNEVVARVIQKGLVEHLGRMH